MSIINGIIDDLEMEAHIIGANSCISTAADESKVAGL